MFDKWMLRGKLLQNDGDYHLENLHREEEAVNWRAVWTDVWELSRESSTKTNFTNWLFEKHWNLTPQSHLSNPILEFPPNKTRRSRNFILNTKKWSIIYIVSSRWQDLDDNNGQKSFSCINQPKLSSSPFIWSLTVSLRNLQTNNFQHLESHAWFDKRSDFNLFQCEIYLGREWVAAGWNFLYSVR